jgi:hypothetical protein
VRAGPGGLVKTLLRQARGVPRLFPSCFGKVQLRARGVALVAEQDRGNSFTARWAAAT